MIITNHGKNKIIVNTGFSGGDQLVCGLIEVKTQWTLGCHCLCNW